MYSRTAGPTNRARRIRPPKRGHGMGAADVFHNMLFSRRRLAMKILMVLTSHDQLGNTGKKTGFWLEEFAAPYYVLKQAGAAVTLASPRGGQPPIDPKSGLPENQTHFTKRFHTDGAAEAELAHTKKLTAVEASDFHAVFYVGGHGPMWDMPDNDASIALIEAFIADN